MSTHAPEVTKSTCQFRKANGEFCKRSVSGREDRCWQHAGSWSHKWKSLTRNQTVAFVGLVLGLILAVVFGWLGLRSSATKQEIADEVVKKLPPSSNGSDVQKVVEPVRFLAVEVVLRMPPDHDERYCETRITKDGTEYLVSTEIQTRLGVNYKFMGRPASQEEVNKREKVIEIWEENKASEQTWHPLRLDVLVNPEEPDLCYLRFIFDTDTALLSRGMKLADLEHARVIFSTSYLDYKPQLDPRNITRVELLANPRAGVSYGFHLACFDIGPHAWQQTPETGLLALHWQYVEIQANSERNCKPSVDWPKD